METWLTSFSRNQLQIVYCLIGRDGPRVLIANGGQVTHLRREGDCNFWFYVFLRLGVVFVSDEHLKQQMERSLFVLRSSKTKLLLMRTSSWTKTRVSSTLSSHFFSAFVYVWQNRDGILPLFVLFLLELSLRALMKFIRRKSEEKREGNENDSTSSCKITLSRLL